MMRDCFIVGLVVTVLPLVACNPSADPSGEETVTKHIRFFNFSSCTIEVTVDENLVGSMQPNTGSDCQEVEITADENDQKNIHIHVKATCPQTAVVASRKRTKKPGPASMTSTVSEYDIHCDLSVSEAFVVQF